MAIKNKKMSKPHQRQDSPHVLTGEKMRIIPHDKNPLPANKKGGKTALVHFQGQMVPLEDVSRAASTNKPVNLSRAVNYTSKKKKKR